MERVVCPVCGREVAAYVPKGGDGTGLRPRKHRDDDGRDCEGRFDTVGRAAETR